jgi:hypothetical protein
LINFQLDVLDRWYAENAEPVAKVFDLSKTL